MSVKCWLGRHKYYLIKNLSKDAQKIGCKRCPKKWGIHHGVKVLVEWDYELEMLYTEGGFTL